MKIRTLIALLVLSTPCAGFARMQRIQQCAKIMNVVFKHTYKRTPLWATNIVAPARSTASRWNLVSIQNTYSCLKNVWPRIAKNQFTRLLAQPRNKQLGTLTLCSLFGYIIPQQFIAEHYVQFCKSFFINNNFSNLEYYLRNGFDLRNSLTEAIGTAIALAGQNPKNPFSYTVDTATALQEALNVVHSDLKQILPNISDEELSEIMEEYSIPEIYFLVYFKQTAESINNGCKVRLPLTPYIHELMLSSLHNIHIQNKAQRTLLHHLYDQTSPWNISQTNPELCNEFATLLINNGINPYAIDCHGNTAQFYAHYTHCD